MKVSENILQFIWKYRLFEQSELLTVSGKKLRVSRVGRHNFDEGPDFENALISIDGIEWVGNVEVHLSSTEWNRHKHQLNPNYNNVILHVVNKYDGEIKREDGTIPETLEMESLVDLNVMKNYHNMIGHMNWIPCEKLIDTIDSFYINQWLNQVLIERLISKSIWVYRLLEEYQGDWENVAFLVLARNFGFKVNSDAFEQLARSFPFRLMDKYKESPRAIEALLYGQAGMLDGQDFEEEYPRCLQKEYSYLRNAHTIRPIGNANWKFLRMRPMGFPNIRIAQFAAFCFTINHFFAKIIETESLDLWKTRFKTLEVNEYWATHYHFKKLTTKHSSKLGDGAIDLILINTIAVLLFSYGKYIGNERYIDRSISFLENIKPENNQIIQQYKKLGIEIKSAAETQALKQLKTIYCEKKRCLSCEIGSQIIKKRRE